MVCKEESIPALTVGICSCTELYHGTLEGENIVVPELTQYRYFGWHYTDSLQKPLVFTLREVRIPEHHGREALEEAGCNFFVDEHGAQSAFPRVSLRMIHPIPEDPAGQHRLYVSELDQSAIGWCGWVEKVWPPTAQMVKEKMGQLISRMDEQGLRQWLELASSKAKVLT